MTHRTLHRLAVIALWALCGFGVPLAQSQELDGSLNESVVMIAKKGNVFSTALETTIFRPDGDGPFPIVVINHGKANGDPRFQGRYRPRGAARFFVQRGYAVVVPMRQGFSKSSGSYIGGGCNVESNGRVQAEDVVAVLDHVGTEPWADKSRIVVAGQSHGGWTTLAFGTLGYSGVKGLIDFSGGLRQEGCVGWQDGLIGAAGAYGKETKVPSIWFYGDNDSFFPPYAWRGMHERYVAGGGKAKLVAFGVFGGDAHAMFGATDGTGIWQPPVAEFLASIGMPSQVVPGADKQMARAAKNAPPPTDFAPLASVDKVPHVGDRGREGYAQFLGRTLPRAPPGGAAR